MSVRRYTEGRVQGYGTFGISQFFSAGEQVLFSFRDEFATIIPPDFSPPEPGTQLTLVLSARLIFTYLRLTAGMTSTFNSDLREGKYAKVVSNWYASRTGEQYLNAPSHRCLPSAYAEIYPFNTELPCDLAPDQPFPTLTDAQFLSPLSQSPFVPNDPSYLADEYLFYPFVNMFATIAFSYRFAWTVYVSPAGSIDPIVIIGV